MSSDSAYVENLVSMRSVYVVGFDEPGVEGHGVESRPPFTLIRGSVRSASSHDFLRSKECVPFTQSQFVVLVG